MNVQNTAYSTTDREDLAPKFVHGANMKESAVGESESTIRRREFLQEVESIVNGDRNVQYGDPNADFTRTAAMWSAFLNHEIMPHEVAAMMILLKISRLSWSPSKRDSWIDVAGYATCGSDVVESEMSNRIAGLHPFDGIVE